MMKLEKMSMWVGICAALFAGVAAYAKINSDTAVALDRSTEVHNTINRIDSKLDVVNGNVERIAKVETRTERVFSDISKIQSSVDGVSKQVSGVSQKVTELNIRQQDVIRRVNEIKLRLPQ
jgi:archaellum component FlaC